MGIVNVKFDSGFNGDSSSDRSPYTFEVGKEKAYPYELAMSGLISCFYSTFMDVAVKKRLKWESCDIEMNYEKDLEATPSFLKTAELKISVKILEGDAEAFDKSFTMAAKYCSLYQTFSKVADVSWSAEYH